MKKIDINGKNCIVEKMAILDSDDIRRMCINQNYYTCGCNSEYMHLLNDIIKNGYIKTTSTKMDNIIIKIANDIYDHSDVDRVVHSYSISEEDVYRNILYNVQQCVMYTFNVNEVCKTI